MPKYYSVTVSLDSEQANGKIKQIKEQYIVDALSCTEAEAKLVNAFAEEKVSVDYEVVKVSETKIVKII